MQTCKDTELRKLVDNMPKELQELYFNDCYFNSVVKSCFQQEKTYEQTLEVAVFVMAQMFREKEKSLLNYVNHHGTSLITGRAEVKFELGGSDDSNIQK